MYVLFSLPILIFLQCHSALRSKLKKQHQLLQQWTTELQGISVICQPWKLNSTLTAKNK